MFVPKKSRIFVTVKGKGDVKGKAPGLHLSTLSGATKKFCSMAKVVNNSRICKATIFVGLNDKESKLQEISTLEAAKYLQREIAKEFEGGTISEATGIYRHQDGTGFVVENTLKVEILFFDSSKEEARRAVIPFINRVKDFLNQETVALQLEEIESELV